MTDTISDTKLAFFTAVNMDNKEMEYIVYIALPGVERENISACIEKRELLISAAKNEMGHCMEKKEFYDKPAWKESFTLPTDADPLMTAAIYRNGELQIHIPKKIYEKEDSDVPANERIKLYIY